MAATEDFKVKNGLIVFDSLIYAPRNGGMIGLFTASPDANLAVVGTANISGAVKLGSSFAVAGNTALTGNTTVGGQFSATGATVFSNTVAIAGHANLQSSLAVVGLSTLTGNASFGGFANVQGSLAVAGVSTHTGNSTFGGTLAVTGAATFSNSISATGVATFSNNISVAGLATFTGNTTIGGFANVAGALIVSGTSSLVGNVAITGAVVAGSGSIGAVNVFSNGFVGIGKDTAAARLDVNGAIMATGDITSSSDLRYKTDIKIIKNAMARINMLDGVTFTRTADNGNIRSTGLIGQQVAMAMPEAVRLDTSGYISVAYASLQGLVVEALKELDMRIRHIEDRIDSLGD